MKNLEFKLTAIDEASGVVAEASKRISNSLNEVSALPKWRSSGN